VHFPSNRLLSQLLSNEVGIWAVPVNEEYDVGLVVRLPTDTIKWIERGVALNLVLGHVQLDNRLVRVVALEVLDC
jgi:hypothetical protein